MKVELEKMLEAKDQAVALYKGTEVEWARYVAKEKEYKDQLNKMGMELNASLSYEQRLQEEIKALRVWEEKANQRAELEKQRAHEEHARIREAIQKVKKANCWAKDAIQRANEAEVKAIKAVETWRESTKFDP